MKKYQLLMALVVIASMAFPLNSVQASYGTRWRSTIQGKTPSAVLVSNSETSERPVLATSTGCYNFQDNFSGPLTWTKAIEIIGPGTPPPPVHTGNIYLDNQMLNITADSGAYDVYAVPSIPTLSGDIEVSVRVKIPSDAGAGTHVGLMLGNGDVTDPGSSQEFKLYHDGVYGQWYMQGIGGTTYQTVGSPDLPRETWVKMAVTRHNNTYTCLVNDVQIYQNTVSQTKPLSYVVVFTANGIVGNSAHAQFDDFSLVACPNPTNRPPVLAPIGNKTVDEGQLLSFTISATDPDNDPLTYSASNLPPDATFDNSFPSKATFSWTPNYSQAGLYSDIRFQVTDGKTTSYENISITVNKVYGYAIIVAGCNNNVPLFQWVVDTQANNVYKVLHNRGFRDSDIYYLNSHRPQDVYGNGGDAVHNEATKENLEKVITELSTKTKPGSKDVPVVLYFIDHGGVQWFNLTADPDGGFNPPTLFSWLAEFPGATRKFVHLNSCYSGSFITDNRSTSAPNTIIITNAHDNAEIGVFDMQRSSLRIWAYLNSGLNIRDAYCSVPVNDLLWLYDASKLLLDDNGDHVGHSPVDLNLGLVNDGSLAQTVTLGKNGSSLLQLASWVTANLLSPGELRVRDSQNRITGLVNGQIFQQIPNSMYDNDEHGVVIPGTNTGYSYDVYGSSAGTYGLNITAAQSNGLQTVSASGIQLDLKALHRYSINWPVLSQGGNGVTLQIDTNGDGTFEKTITSGSQLTHDQFMLQTGTRVEIEPHTLYLGSKGKFVTAYIQLPNGYDPHKIDISTVKLNGKVSALSKLADIDDDGKGDVHDRLDRFEKSISDFDKDDIAGLVDKFKSKLDDCRKYHIPGIMVKFDRKAVEGILPFGNDVDVAVSGQVSGVYFEGHDKIRVITPKK